MIRTVAALTVAAAVTVWPAYSQSDNMPAEVVPPAYVITTHNVLHTLGTTKARHDLHRDQTGSDLVVTQEMSQRRAARFRLPGWSSTQPSDNRSLSIYWHPPFRYAGSFPVLLHRSQMFRSATRYALAARFNVDRACLLVVDVHMIPHIEHAGRPRHLPRRGLVDRATRRLAALTRFARTGRCALLIGGDWNVDGYADARVRSTIFPFARLTGVGLRSEWTTFPHTSPTLGRRHVDGFYYVGVRTLSRRIIGRTYSDHNADRLTFRITR